MSNVYNFHHPVSPNIISISLVFENAQKLCQIIHCWNVHTHPKITPRVHHSDRERPYRSCRYGHPLHKYDNSYSANRIIFLFFMI